MVLPFRKNVEKQLHVSNRIKKEDYRRNLPHFAAVLGLQITAKSSLWQIFGYINKQTI